MNTVQTHNGRTTKDEFAETMAVGIIAATGRLLWLAVRFPFASVPLVLFLTSIVLGGKWTGPAIALACATLYGLWFHLDDASYRKLVWQPMWEAWLSWSRYTASWEEVCTLHGLATKLGDRLLVPKLLWLRIGSSSDELVVQIVAGQTASDWQKQAQALAEAWGCPRLTVRSSQPGQVSLLAHRDDELSEPARLPRPCTDSAVDLASVRVGRADGARPWTLPILGHHVLVAGATGSGKGSVLWSIIASLAPDVRTGRAQLCVVDPKGGMELGKGAPLFSDFSYDHAEATLALLRRLVALMTKRAQQLRGRTRLHTPTAAEPLIVLIIDELASLTAYGTDRKIRAEIEQNLGLILSQGRAVGVSVVAAVQDPSKEVLPVRQLFTIRIALRMTETTQTTMVLGAAARDAGAICDQIADSTPGVGYVMVDGASEPLRVRAFHVRDDDIDYLAERFAPAKSWEARGASNERATP